MRRILLFVLFVVLVAFLFTQFPYAVSKTDDKMRLLYLGIILSFCALGARKIPLNQTLLYSAAWIFIFFALVAGYSYKDKLLNSRIVAELLPNRAHINKDRTLAIRASANGHFYVEAKVNGVSVNFMIDTGASDVALSKEDAQRIGINPNTLSYTKIYQTANGATRGAPIKLKRLQIGDFILDNFPASVNEGELGDSLLGMRALKELGGFNVQGDQMIIGNSVLSDAN